ncbi:H-type small acid-soluble spore protein [Bacillus alkalicellulosilyticus]|uniref:H-type small acid-soluble spore protein n=1 Tax=Alkalihalobacterium alkalicellulosilyticum TaxID=1912214 RepID=UPI000997134C|nr:H-type small acid-soluble spore protein [Bacillus alkalicellulosilyticus]
MNVQRAQEIIESPQEINVQYNGTPVWIQHVNEDEATARVFKANSPEDEMTVPVDQLLES